MAGVIGGQMWGSEEIRLGHEEGISPLISGMPRCFSARRKYSSGVAKTNRAGDSLLKRSTISTRLSGGAQRSEPKCMSIGPSVVA